MSRSCVAMTKPPQPGSRIMRSNSRTAAASRPAVGSSMRSQSGAVAKVVASARRRCCPPLSEKGDLSMSKAPWGSRSAQALRMRDSRSSALSL
nr:hypothetical protein [Paenibacillus sp. N3.4]